MEGCALRTDQYEYSTTAEAPGTINYYTNPLFNIFTKMDEENDENPALADDSNETADEDSTITDEEAEALIEETEEFFEEEN